MFHSSISVIGRRLLSLGVSLKNVRNTQEEGSNDPSFFCPMDGNSKKGRIDWLCLFLF
jgi:hypothetical protein